MDEHDIEAMFRPIIYKDWVPGRIELAPTKHYPSVKSAYSLFGRRVYRASCRRDRLGFVGPLTVKAHTIEKLASKWNRAVWKWEKRQNKYEWHLDVQSHSAPIEEPKDPPKTERPWENHPTCDKCRYCRNGHDPQICKRGLLVREYNPPCKEFASKYGFPVDYGHNDPKITGPNMEDRVVCEGEWED